MKTPKRAASRRVAWPERGKPDGGEFRLTMPRLLAIASLIVAVPSLWAIGGHYMNKDEITTALAAVKAEGDRAIAANKAETDRVIAANKADTDRVIVANKVEEQKALAEHENHDNSQQAWNQYNLAAGLATNRVEYLDDKQAECDAKRLTMPKLPPSDAVICTRIEVKLKTKNEEVATLKAKAQETTKPKPQAPAN